MIIYVNEIWRIVQHENYVNHFTISPQISHFALVCFHIILMLSDHHISSRNFTHAHWFIGGKLTKISFCDLNSEFHALACGLHATNSSTRPNERFKVRKKWDKRRECTRWSIERWITKFGYGFCVRASVCVNNEVLAIIWCRNDIPSRLHRTLRANAFACSDRGVHMH